MTINTRKPWFTPRHYEFLVNWAATNLDARQVSSLADALGVDNPAFKQATFVNRYLKLRQRVTPTCCTYHASGGALELSCGGEELEKGRKVTELMLNLPEDRASSGGKAIPPALLGREGAARGPVIPGDQLRKLELDQRLRTHKKHNEGRGVWVYHTCWKCYNGTRPDQCPVACKGACEYPSAVND